MGQILFSFRFLSGWESVDELSEVVVDNSVQTSVTMVTQATETHIVSSLLLSRLFSLILFEE